LQRAFPLDVLMVLSSVLVVAVDGECLACGGFTLGETVHFGRLEFITDCFGGMSLSPRRDGSDVAFMGSTHRRPPSPLWAMMGDSTKEFHMVSSGEVGSSLPSPRRHDTGAPPSPATTTSWLESTPATQAMMTVPPRMMTSRPDTSLPFE
jgi:hypothetical protein